MARLNAPLNAPFDVLQRLPANVLNGAGVSLGISCIFGLGWLLGGPAAALGASAGAVYGSLPDVPLAPTRTWRRVLTGVIVGVVAAAAVSLLRSHEYALGVLLAVIAFTSALALAWGPRAGPASFVGLIAFVFTMAAPASPSLLHIVVSVGWAAFGGALYVGWATLVAHVLQPRYRTLALASVLEALTDMLRLRATLVVSDERAAATGPSMVEWIGRESVLEEKLQAARDLLFAAPPSPEADRRIAMLLVAIELRDTLLLGQLDLELLGHDSRGESARGAVAAAHAQTANAIAAVAEALRLGHGVPPAPHPDPLPTFPSFASDDPRAPVAVALTGRTHHVAADVARLRELLQGEAPALPLTRTQLALFVSAEGWPLAAIRPQLTLASPVLRHAVRSSVALTAAYFIALALPWASHPHWLVLSVAVVLRGTLEQTLSRRNIRVAGTLAGCGVVMVIGQWATHGFSTAVYLAATGFAHAFATANYFVTAIAATVMALLQNHLAHPLGEFAVSERFADTLVGALLAWGFSYLLPSWEREGVGRMVARLTRGLALLAQESLRAPGSGDDVPARAARREVYAALLGVAAAAQRTRVEPASVRVPSYAYVSVIERGHLLLAQLAAVRLLVARRGAEIEPEALARTLEVASADLARALGVAPSEKAAASLDQAATGEAAALPPLLPAFDHGAKDLGSDALLPWLRRRLANAEEAARRYTPAARALDAAVAVKRGA